MKKGDTIVLKVENLSGDGRTVAKHNGFVFFVENAVPGDDVLARILRIKKKYAEARALEVVSPSAYRTEPKCKHFGICGGCRWQNLLYTAQLEFKRKLVFDAFEYIGGFLKPSVEDVIACDDPYFYRNKMEFTFSDNRWLTEEELLKKEKISKEIVLGLHILNRYDKVLNIEKCYLQSEIGNAILNSVRDICRNLNLSAYSTKTHKGYLRHLVIRESKTTKDLMVNIITTFEKEDTIENIKTLLIKGFPEITTIVNNVTTRKAMVARGEIEKVCYGNGYIRERIGQYEFEISSNSFFQTNTRQVEKLYDVVKKLANFKKSDVVYDFYSGTGTIAIYLSDVVDCVIGVEVEKSAVKDAERNAMLNHVSNCYFIQGDLKAKLTKDRAWLSGYPPPEVIVCDPPRSGMHPKVVEKILELNPKRIVYVSCNPSTQARDAKIFSNAGYLLKIIQPIDMFPHTDHIEVVALFTR